MTKKQILKALDFVKNLLVDDRDATIAVEMLVEKVQLKDIDSPSSNIVKTDEYPIPSEVQENAKAVAVFSDGACRGNPGPGAWATMAQLSDGAVLYTSSGVDMPTTNNRMEMQGAIEGLKCLKDSLSEIGGATNYFVYLYSDSRYLVDGVEKWLPGWKRRGWKKSDNKSPENIELWQDLDALLNDFKQIKFFWVKGHAGHPQNEYCDQMANQALDESGY